jgi:hypothetical protein
LTVRRLVTERIARPRPARASPDCASPLACMGPVAASGPCGLLSVVDGPPPSSVDDLTPVSVEDPPPLGVVPEGDDPPPVAVDDPPPVPPGDKPAPVAVEDPPPVAVVPVADDPPPVAVDEPPPVAVGDDPAPVAVDDPPVVPVVPAAHAALEMVFLWSVTAALRASALPFTVTPSFRVIDCRARMFPVKTESVPSVAELPTCQTTLQASAPRVSSTRLDDAVMRVDAGAWKMKTAFWSFWPSSVRVPVR